VYAFVSPDRPDTVTLIANYIPFETPASGPNFYFFGDDVLYEIHIDNDGDAQADITYQFRFKRTLTDPSSFLYNTGPILSLDSSNWNSRQSYSVTRVTHGQSYALASGLACPPCNIGPLSTPDYPQLAQSAVHSLPSGINVFAGQRADPFYVDVGSIFDLINLRPFQQLHAQFGMNLFPKAAPGVNGLGQLNIHSIAIQVPISQLLSGSKHGSVNDQGSVIGVWTTASRQIPLSQKDLWNTLPPSDDKQFAVHVTHPELAARLPGFYPGVFPNLAKLVQAGTPRADLEAILLTGIPSGIVPGFQNFTGPVLADMIRLNTAIAPSAKPNPLGVIGGDLAGFPNGRRVFDDTVTIELRAVAGLTFALVDKTFKPDAAASVVTDGLTPASVPSGFLGHFPYVGVPYSGFETPS